MSQDLRCSPHRFRWFSVCCGVAALVFAVVFVHRAADAQNVAYSFEDGVQGFGPNGGGITVAQDTIGATQGTHSLRLSVVGGATFVGASTSVLDPLIFGNPPGIDHLLVDLTLPTVFGPTPPSGFAVIGFTVFGVSQTGVPADVQFLASEVHLDGVAAGLVQNLRIDLTNATHPVTFEENLDFNDIFGTAGSGPNDVIPTGFQFYINKTGSPAHALTVYLDNVRFGMTPEPVDGDYNADGIVDAADYTVWRDNLGLAGGATVLQGDGTGDGNVTGLDYDFWRDRFGNTSVGGAAVSAGAVPEPAGAALILLAAACALKLRRLPIG